MWSGLQPLKCSMLAELSESASSRCGPAGFNAVVGPRPARGEGERRRSALPQRAMSGEGGAEIRHGSLGREAPRNRSGQQVERFGEEAVDEIQSAGLIGAELTREEEDQAGALTTQVQRRRDPCCSA
jgi:hypothetical protein